MHALATMVAMIDSSLPWDRLDERALLSARIAAETARDIVEGRSRAGDWLTEAMVATSHGASRTPAREAMLQLQTWRLVRLVPKKGAIVADVSPDERRDLLGVRAMFEIDAVTSLADAPERFAALAADLDTLLASQRDAHERGDLRAFAANDFAFHERLIRGGGNQVVIDMLVDLAPRLARLTHGVIAANPNTTGELLAEHVELTQLARAGDVSSFAQAVRAHIAAAYPMERGAA